VTGMVGVGRRSGYVAMVLVDLASDGRGPDPRGSLPLLHQILHSVDCNDDTPGRPEHSEGAGVSSPGSYASTG